MIEVKDLGLPPRQLIESLSPDEEAPQRARQFRDLVYLSCDSCQVADQVKELYRLAAADEWAMSLHDRQMLLYAVELNWPLARQLRRYIDRMLERFPPTYVASYRAWLRHHRLEA